MLTSIDTNLALPYWNRPAVDRLLHAGVDWERAASSLGGASPSSLSESAKRGLRYERKVLTSLHHRLGLRNLSQLPFFFQTNSKRGRAIIDGLVLLGSCRALVVECKLQFSADAWYQVHKFYLPIVREALPGLDVRGLIITASFDPWVKVPKEPRLVDSPEAVYDARKDDLCVLISRNGSI